MGARLNPRLRGFQCSRSGELFPIAKFTGPVGLCSCCPHPAPLYSVYDGPGDIVASAPGLRAFESMLPVVDLPAGYVDDVGRTPMFRSPQLSAELGVDLWLKSEVGNPTGSFKDRGLCMAIALGAVLGARRFMLPTQGNAGVAAAAFSARIGLGPCIVYMPEGHRGSYYHRAAERFGAALTFVGDNIAAAGKAMRSDHAAALAAGEALDVSTFFEPGRLEGKKTMGIEIVESFTQERLGELDGIVYPTGGGTGLVGIARAYAEARAAGRGGQTPRLFAVQSENCAPVVDAFDRGDAAVTPIQSRGTAADGLDVPAAIMGHGILSAIRDSGGAALRVSEAEMLADERRMSVAGYNVGLESAATLAGLRHALDRGQLRAGQRVLLLLTGGAMARFNAAQP